MARAGFISVFLWPFCVSVVLALAIAGPAGAEEAAKPEPATVRKSKDGLQFQVPPDWPVEKRGGITAPIPIEEYLGRKFTAIEAQLQGLEQRFNGLDVRLRVVEEELKKQRQAQRSMEQPPGPGPQEPVPAAAPEPTRSAP